jgi:hypothetical protein
MVTARYLAVATLLPNGKVLVSGGISTIPQTAVASAELYDPTTNTWIRPVHWSSDDICYADPSAQRRFGCRRS